MQAKMNRENEIDIARILFSPGIDEWFLKIEIAFS